MLNKSEAAVRDAIHTIRREWQSSSAKASFTYNQNIEVIMYVDGLLKLLSEQVGTRILKESSKNNA